MAGHRGMSIITRRDIDGAYRIAKKARDEAEQKKERGAYLSGQIAQSLEVTGAALAVGVLGGRFGRTTLLGIDLDLIAGLTLWGVGYSGVLGKWSDHAHNVGDGVLAGFATKFGASLGNTMRASAGEAPLLPGTEGIAAIGAGGNDHHFVSTDDIARMAVALRQAA